MEMELHSDLRNNDIHQVMAEMYDEMDSWPYAQVQIEIKENLRKMFLRYSTLDTQSRERLDKLVIQHKQYCSESSNTTYIRQHNSFVLRYANGLSVKSIARGQAINIRTVCKDLSAVLDRMMIYLLGFYGVRWDKR